MPPAPTACQWVGIGLRQPHYAEWGHAPPALGFVELHAENFFAQGGATLQVLDAVRERSALSLHGVGLGLGSAVGLDGDHLARLRALVQRADPLLVSEHACFARAELPVGGHGSGSALAHGHGARGTRRIRHASDLLPMPFDDASLQLLSQHVMQVQDALGRAIAVENLASYLPEGSPWFPVSTWAEPEFFNALAQRTGCAVLLDINNLVVNALNAALRTHHRAHDGPGGQAPNAQAGGRGIDWAGLQPQVLASVGHWLDALQPGIVAQVHLAGYGTPLMAEANPRGDDALARAVPLVVDDHSAAPSEAVWLAYAHALRRFGPVATLVEWDTQLPPLEVLVAQAHRAAKILGDTHPTAVFRGLARVESAPQAHAAVTPPDVAPSLDIESQPAGWAWATAAGVALPRNSPAQSAVQEDKQEGKQEESSQATHELAQEMTQEMAQEAARQAGLLQAVQPAPLSAAAQREWLTSPDRRGLLAYRAHAGMSAETVLGHAYHTVAAVLGPAAFATLARAFWQAHGPTEGDLARWGAGLGAFMAGQPQLHDHAYLADLAALEWALWEAEPAADIQVCLSSLSQLQTASPAALRLVLAPGSALLRSPWPVYALWRAHQSDAAAPASHGSMAGDFGADSQLESPAESAEPRGPLGEPTATCWMERWLRAMQAAESTAPGAVQVSHIIWVWRQGWVARAVELSPAQARWLAQALRAPSLDTLIRHASAADSEDAISFSEWLTDAVRHGWVLGVQPAEEGAVGLEPAGCAV
jgi:uncharacterized protein (UPF0276 family)